MALNLEQILENAKKAKPIGENNGIKIVSFEEQRDLAVKAKAEGGLITDTITFNPDGSVARTPTQYAAVNLDHYYINRFKKVRDSYMIVRDYRAIQEQRSGVIYATNIPCYVVVADENGEPVLDKMVSVSDREFIADFTHTLDRESMQFLMERGVFDSEVGTTPEKLSFGNKKGDTK